MKLSCVGIDLAKNVFQVHGVDEAGKKVVGKQLRRDAMLGYFRQQAPCLIGMEACGSAHYWARELSAQGHDVRIMAPQFVKPYVKGNKTDANDAAAICEAVSRPSMRFVSIKSVDQQMAQAEHRVRARLVRARTALSNEIRGLLGELGVIIKPGLCALRQALPDLLEDADHGVPDWFRRLLAELRDELVSLDERLASHDRHLQDVARQDERVQRLMAIEGMGVISATALVSAVGDAKQFADGRAMASWLGIVPSEHSSGGKQRLGGISKRGSTYLRTLMIHGARAALKAAATKTDRRSEWVNQLSVRRNRNIATVALANKNVRIAWSILARGETYRAAA